MVFALLSLFIFIIFSLLQEETEPVLYFYNKALREELLWTLTLVCKHH